MTYKLLAEVQGVVLLIAVLYIIFVHRRAYKMENHLRDRIDALLDLTEGVVDGETALAEEITGAGTKDST